MTSSAKPITPLRQRMIDDMRMRKLSPKTQDHYIRTVKQPFTVSEKQSLISLLTDAWFPGNSDTYLIRAAHKQGHTISSALIGVFVLKFKRKIKSLL